MTARFQKRGYVGCRKHPPTPTVSSTRKVRGPWPTYAAAASTGSFAVTVTRSVVMDSVTSNTAVSPPFAAISTKSVEVRIPSQRSVSVTATTVLMFSSSIRLATAFAFASLPFGIRKLLKSLLY